MAKTYTSKLDKGDIVYFVLYSDIRKSIVDKVKFNGEFSYIITTQNRWCTGNSNIELAEDDCFRTIEELTEYYNQKLNAKS